jgi:putative nucleotidyltransferase with HDIG domain
MNQSQSGERLKKIPKEFHPTQQLLNVRVFEVAQKHCSGLYLVGGYIRDALLSKYSTNNPPRDFDYIVLGAKAIEVAAQVAQAMNGHYVLLDTEFDTARVVFDDGSNADFAGCIGGNIQADVQRRDFTINALVWDPNKPDEIIDLTGGIKDLEDRVVRAISEDNLIDDPLRILRAFRMVGTVSGAVENKTLEMLARNASRLASIAGERISYELFCIMDSPNAYPVIVQMGEIGVLENIFPELSATRNVTPNAFHHLNLWEHSLELVRQAEIAAPKLPIRAAKSFDQELGWGVKRLAATKIACLLHDIGKPSTWQINEDGRHTFYGHDKIGADMTELIGERLRWSSKVSRFITNLVRWHLRPGQLFHQGTPTTRAVQRFYRQINDDISELTVLALADLASTCGQGIPIEDRKNLQKNLIELLEGYYVFRDAECVRVQLIDGSEIMQLLNIPAGPLVGQLLQQVVEAQGLGEVKTSEEAKEFVISSYRKLANNNPS